MRSPRSAGCGRLHTPYLFCAETPSATDRGVPRRVTQKTMMEQSQKGDNGRTSGTTSMSRFLVGFPGETCNDKRVTCPTEVDTHVAAPPARRTRKPVQRRSQIKYHQQISDIDSHKAAIVEVWDGRTKPNARCFSTPGAASANISKLHTTCMVRQSHSSRAANY